MVSRENPSIGVKKPSIGGGNSSIEDENDGINDGVNDGVNARFKKVDVYSRFIEF